MPAISDEEWAEISQEIPKAEDGFLQKYLEGRAALVAEEKKQRADYRFWESLSPVAKKACAIVDGIRRHEKETIWTPDLEEQLAQRERAITVHPGMMFNLAKETMEKTKLWKIIRRMPKGALLHAHCDAMVDFDWVLDVVLSTPGMHLSCPAGHLATAEARSHHYVNVVFRKNESPGDGATPWSSDYEPGAFVRLTRAADAFPDGGRAGFVAWFKSRCTISETDALEQHHGVDEIWRKFHRSFMFVGNMGIHYEPIWRRFLGRLMHQLVDDGVSWVEIRFGWRPNYCREGCETPEPDFDHVFQCVEEEVARFRATPEGKNFWGMRMIWTSLRWSDRRALIENMDHCITTKMQHPHLIAGYDLVGPEDRGRTLRDMLPELMWLRRQCAAEGVELPLFLHAGETLGDGDETDENLFDALLLGARRLGHGFSLYKHPSLVQAVREKRILIESCPISNELLRLCGSILSHPLPALLARGVACSLNNDDPAMLGQHAEGITHEFWQSLQGWENLGLAGLGSLAENSVRWAAFEDEDAESWARHVREASLGQGVKAQRLKEWSVEWEKFCLWIVTEFADEAEAS